MRAVIAAAFIVLVPVLARAEDAPPLVFSPLAPVALRPTHNAARLAAMCMQSKAIPAGTCKARTICERPLDPTVPLPTDDERQALIAGRCASRAPNMMDLHTNTDERLGVSWQSEIISGIVAFLVDRAKAEALAALVQHLKDEVCQGGAEIMPATCGLLAHTAPYVDPVAWSPLKAAFESDLAALPERLVRRVVDPVGDDGQPLLLLIESGKLIDAGADPFEVLIGIRDKYAVIDSPALCAAHRVPCALRLFGATAEILTPSEQSLAAASDTELLQLQWSLAIGLFRRELAPLGLDPSAPFDSAGEAASVQRFTAAFGKIHDALAVMKTYAVAADVEVRKVREGRPGASRDDARSAYVGYVRAISNVLEAVPVVTRLTRLAGHGNASIGDAFDVSRFEDAIDHGTLAIEHARAGEWVPGFVELQGALAAARIPVPAWFGKYGGFIVQVAAARSAEEVKQAFAAAAAPVGAWRTKRGAHRHALTLNGYVGVQGGAEWLGGKSAPGGATLQGGLFAPVGVEASWGVGGASSLGVMLAAIDLGALVDVRADSSSSATTTSNLGFRQVFSPGVFGIWGLPGAPLALGVGVSLSPSLRSVDVAGGTSFDANALRLSVFFAVDVTIFGL